MVGCSIYSSCGYCWYSRIWNSIRIRWPFSRYMDNNYRFGSLYPVSGIFKNWLLNYYGTQKLFCTFLRRILQEYVCSDVFPKYTVARIEFEFYNFWFYSYIWFQIRWSYTWLYSRSFDGNKTSRHYLHVIHLIDPITYTSIRKHQSPGRGSNQSSIIKHHKTKIT